MIQTPVKEQAKVPASVPVEIMCAICKGPSCGKEIHESALYLHEPSPTPDRGDCG